MPDIIGPLKVTLNAIPAPQDIGITSLRTLEGAYVVHPDLGSGQIKNVYPGHDGDYRIVVGFGHEKRILCRSDTDSGFVLTIKEPGRLESGLHLELTEPGTIVLALLARVYSCLSPDAFDSQHFMRSILLKVDRRQELEESEIDRLKSAEDFGPLGLYFEHRRVADREEQVWSRVTACGYWRKAKLPDRNVDLSERMLKALPNSRQWDRVRAALLTTQGGAYRDKQHFDQAISLAS